jgi:hypothetical protein
VTSYTSGGRYTLQDTGSNNNTWGNILNSGVFTLIDTNVNGVLSFALSGTKTLTTELGATDEARNAVLKITSGSGGTITIPSVSKKYTVINNAGGPVGVTTGSGAVGVCQQNEQAEFVCDGTNVTKTFATDFGGSRVTSVGTPSVSTDAANKAYVDNAAFNANAGVLPGQTGNSGKFLTTNGAAASWAFPTVSSISDYATDQATRATALDLRAIAWAVSL